MSSRRRSRPAASVGPSRPSVPAASSATPAAGASRTRAAASASSWDRPPSPAPRSLIVTVVSPPRIRQRAAARVAIVRRACEQLAAMRSPAAAASPDERRLDDLRDQAELAARRPPLRARDGCSRSRWFSTRSTAGSPGFGVSGMLAALDLVEVIAQAREPARPRVPPATSASRTSARCGRIGDARSRSDGGQIVADHIRDDVAAARGGVAEAAREPAARPIA